MDAACILFGAGSIATGVPPAWGRLVGWCDARLDVLVRRALGERAAAAEQDGELVV